MWKTQSLNNVSWKSIQCGIKDFEKKKSVVFFKGTQALRHSLIHLIWLSCREHVPKRHRLGLLANWDDLTREICTIDGV